MSGLNNTTLIKFIKACWDIFEGPYSNELDERIAIEINGQHGVYVHQSFGSLAKVVEILNLKQSEQVLIPTFPYISSVEQILRKHAVPTLIKTDAYSWNISAKLLAVELQEDMRAVIAVNITGSESEILKMIELAIKYRTTIILDDTTQNALAMSKKQPGSFDNVLVLNFYQESSQDIGARSVALCDIRLLQKVRGCCGTTLFRSDSSSFLKVLI